MELALYLAYTLLAIADAVMYAGLLALMAKSFKYHRFIVLASALFMAPFLYLLAYAGSMANFLWMLFLTPFYGVAVLILLYPASMAMYYLAAFVALALTYLLTRRTKKTRSTVTDEEFWDALRKNR